MLTISIMAWTVFTLLLEESALMRLEKNIGVTLTISTYTLSFSFKYIFLAANVLIRHVKIRFSELSLNAVMYTRFFN